MRLRRMLTMLVASIRNLLPDEFVKLQPGMPGKAASGLTCRNFRQYFARLTEFAQKSFIEPRTDSIVRCCHIVNNRQEQRADIWGKNHINLLLPGHGITAK